MSRSCLPARVTLPRPPRAARRPGSGSSCRRARRCSTSWSCRLRTNRAEAAVLAVSSAVSYRVAWSPTGLTPRNTRAPPRPISTVPRFQRAALPSGAWSTPIAVAGLQHAHVARGMSSSWPQRCGDPLGRPSDHAAPHHLRHPRERGRSGDGPSDICPRAAQHVVPGRSRRLSHLPVRHARCPARREDLAHRKDAPSRIITCCGARATATFRSGTPLPRDSKRCPRHPQAMRRGLLAPRMHTRSGSGEQDHTRTGADRG